VNQHALHPFIHTFSNHRSRAEHLRVCPVPDVHPASALLADDGAAATRFSMSAGDFCSLYGRPSAAGTFGVVATCFFIDTAPNLLAYLEAIWNVLEDGGVWVNYGPLLWHYEEASNTGGREMGVELTLEEVLIAVARSGFRILERRRGERGGYTDNGQAMLRHLYQGEFWAAEKLPKTRQEVIVPGFDPENGVESVVGAGVGL